MHAMFKVDTHMHTAETSKCGRIPAKNLVERYLELGYQAIIITDHLHESYIDLLYCRDDWNTCVDRFLDGYRRAKEYGDKLGLQVILGCELRFHENDNDYLVYGIDEAFLRQHPYPFRMGPEAFYDKFKDEVLIIHAHPFREGCAPPRYNCVHGIELVNGHVDHVNHNDRSLALCIQHPELYRMAGSDAHREGNEGWAWAVFDAPITDSHTFANAVRRGGYTLGARLPEDQAILAQADAHFGARNKHAV